MAERHGAGTRGDELRATTGWHRKHALRALRSAGLRPPRWKGFDVAALGRLDGHLQARHAQQPDFWSSVALVDFALYVALSQGQQHGWTSGYILGLLAISSICLGLFLVTEWHVAHPVSAKTVAPGEVLSTLVSASNDCKPAPVPPVRVAFVFSDGSRLVADAVSPTDTTTPPCNGAGSPAEIDMHPWAK